MTPLWGYGMDERELPRIARLSGVELSRARQVAMHSPVPSSAGTLTWTVTLMTVDEIPLAESLVTSPDYPMPLSEIAQPHLDVVRLVAVGPWQAESTEDGSPRFSTAVRVAATE